MMLQKITRVLLAFSMMCLPCVACADYFPWLSITNITTSSSGSSSISLSDGSTWNIDSFNSPNVQKWVQLFPVWIMPIYQAGSPSTNVMAVLFGEGLVATMATLNTGSTTLTITSVDSTAGTVSLSDGTSWTLDPHFQKYYATWQVGDPMTLTGHHYLYYLLNGTSRSQQQTFSGATQIK